MKKLYYILIFLFVIALTNCAKEPLLEGNEGELPTLQEGGMSTGDEGKGDDDDKGDDDKGGDLEQELEDDNDITDPENDEDHDEDNGNSGLSSSKL